MLAVETKYHGRVQPGRAEADRRRRDVKAAQDAEDKIQSPLRAKQLYGTTTVTAVLIIWGTGSPELPQGYGLVDGVYALDGDHPDVWSHLFNTPRLTAEQRTKLHKAFNGFLQKRQGHTSPAGRSDSATGYGRRSGT